MNMNNEQKNTYVKKQITAALPKFASMVNIEDRRKVKKSKEKWEKYLLFLRVCDIIYMQLRRYVLGRVLLCISKNTKQTGNIICVWLRTNALRKTDKASIEKSLC
jgi:hypothetical protein